MSKRDAGLLLADIIEAIQKISIYTQNLCYDDFADDPKTIDAVTRNLQVIGEAANRLPDSLIAQHRSIPWNAIIGMRHRLVHEYFGIDLGIIWTTATRDLPALLEQLQQILADF